MSCVTGRNSCCGDKGTVWETGYVKVLLSLQIQKHLQLQQCHCQGETSPLFLILYFIRKGIFYYQLGNDKLFGAPTNFHSINSYGLINWVSCCVPCREGKVHFMQVLESQDHSHFCD